MRAARSASQAFTPLFWKKSLYQQCPLSHSLVSLTSFFAPCSIQFCSKRATSPSLCACPGVGVGCFSFFTHRRTGPKPPQRKKRASEKMFAGERTHQGLISSITISKEKGRRSLQKSALRSLRSASMACHQS